MEPAFAMAFAGAVDVHAAAALHLTGRHDQQALARRGEDEVLTKVVHRVRELLLDGEREATEILGAQTASAIVVEFKGEIIAWQLEDQ